MRMNPVGELAYVGLVSSDPAAACAVFERHLALPRNDLDSAGGAVAVFSIGRSALAVFPPGHPLVGDEAKPGVHHIALGVDDLARAGEAAGTAEAPGRGLGGRRSVALPREATAGVRTLLTEKLALAAQSGGPLERIDHVGVASTDVREDEAAFAGRLGFEVESRQTDMEVITAVESFTSDKYGVVYHARKPEPVGGLRVCFITIGDCELEFLANFDPRQGGDVEHGRSGTTRQDQGAIARFVASRGRGLHHIALKTPDIDGTLAALAGTGVPLIDARGRPGSRRALIGFLHPRALGGVLLHLVQRP
jgi:catechol 2,3-dioxygenase-like lactoylglutathione lyase family enzyme